MKDIRKETALLESYFSIVRREKCTADEEDAIRFRLQCGEELPAGIITNNDGTHSKYDKGSIEDSDVEMWLEYRRLMNSFVIKRCAIICAISTTLTWVIAFVAFVYFF